MNNDPRNLAKHFIPLTYFQELVKGCKESSDGAASHWFLPVSSKCDEFMHRTTQYGCTFPPQDRNWRIDQDRPPEGEDAISEIVRDEVLRRKYSLLKKIREAKKR